MKKGRKYRTIINKAKTIFHSGFIMSIVGFIILTIISLDGIVVNAISFVADENKIKDIVSIVVSSISFIVSLIGTIKSAITLKHNSFHRQPLEQAKYKAEVKTEVLKKKNISPEYIKNNYKWDEYNNESFLYSDKVDKALFERADQLLLNVGPKKQAMGNDQREALYKIVEHKISLGKNIFNSNLVRLRTDMLIDTVLASENNIQEINKEVKDQTKSKTRFKDLKLVDVEKTDYFYNLTSNDQIFNQIFKFDYSSIFYGKEMTVDKYNNLYNLSQSPAANIIGVNTLAITSDGFLIINKQNNNNDVNNNRFVPSGSGSSDFEDLKNCVKLENKKPHSKVKQLEERIESYQNGIADMNDIKTRMRYFSVAQSQNSDSEGLKYFNKLVNDYISKSEDKKDVKNIRKYVKKAKKYTCDFKKFITYGMVRELIEESHICKHDNKKETLKAINKYIDSTFICGFIRLLDRGGKPDFFGITLLDKSKEEVEKSFRKYRIQIAKTELIKKCRITDFNEACEQRLISVTELENCENIKAFEAKLNEVYDKKDKAKVSLQLYYLFKFLSNNKSILDRFKKTVSILE